MTDVRQDACGIVTFPAGTPAPATLVGAIAAVMNEVHTVAKRGVNEFHRYRYARMEDILQEITPRLGKHGLVIFQSETGRAMFDEDNVIAVEYSFTVAHVSGETWAQPLRQTGVSTCRNSKGGWDDKSLNKCHTAARKYFLLALFQIPTGEEADADLGENERKQSSAFKQASISHRAIAARVSQAWQGCPTEPFLASEAGKRDVPDADIEARRAAAQLKSKLPQQFVEPPKRRLDRALDKQRDTGAGYEALIKAEQRREGKFRQPLRPQYDERNPPPSDDIPEFLDRRR
jgi:ERF superfamily